MAMEEGKAAPLFTLPDQTGEKVALKDLKGKTVVIYFYPKDDTPGCTKEAAAVIYGARSRQRVRLFSAYRPTRSHRTRPSRPSTAAAFRLLADPTRKVMEKYDA